MLKNLLVGVIYRRRLNVYYYVYKIVTMMARKSTFVGTGIEISYRTSYSMSSSEKNAKAQYNPFEIG